MTEYRAQLIGIKLERPLQNIGYNLSAISEWIDRILVKYPQGTVELYALEEKLITRKFGARQRDCTCGHSAEQHKNTTSASSVCSLGACNKMECECKKYERNGK